MSVRTAVRLLLKKRCAAMLAGACLALNLLPSPPANAHSVTDRSVRVRVHDLDLSTDAGARRLLRRLDHAVEIVCGGSFLQQFSAARRAYRSCYERTMTETLARLDAPRVNAHYAQRRARAGEIGRGRSS
ncbi:MAG TPA: UrcA family protein [Vitreimonas sp.]|uniref:UrcA family protein n=1 Tax=Vitreimonas sp. TaxID=3069702 RepID=UPI002D5224B5|nr:UrcA family protein [Vitreimonas sp.]HYD87977.1 UrcA family protein [Vitreimonas sp.]